MDPGLEMLDGNHAQKQDQPSPIGQELVVSPMSQTFLDEISSSLPPGSVMRTLDFGWDGSVVISYQSPEMHPDDGYSEYLNIRKLSPKQLEQLEPYFRQQRSKYPNEKLRGGAIVVRIEDGKLNSHDLGGRVTRNGGGWSWQTLSHKPPQAPLVDGVSNADANSFGIDGNKTVKATVTEVGGRDENQVKAAEFEIVSQLQRTDYDCGQTCLDMLGYDGHKMFPNKAVEANDLRSISGVREVTVPVGMEETLNYNFPHIWIILGKDRVAGDIHWVIRYKNKIYCPTIGEVDAVEYKKRYVNAVMQEYLVPFSGQQLSQSRTYDQQPESQPKVHEVIKNLTKALRKLFDSGVKFGVGHEYIFLNRRVKYLRDRTLSNGIKQFEVEYLDEPPNDSSIHQKKGQREWHGEWQLRRLEEV